MTREQFLLLLSELHKNGQIEATIEQRKELGRGTILLRKPGEAYQIYTGTVVVFIGKFLNPDKPGWLCSAFVNAGKDIDLSAEDATALERASAKADYLGGHDAELRAHLLTLLGLTELADETPQNQESTAA